MAVRAVLTTAQEEAFRTACGVRGDIEAHFYGWSKRVLLSADRAFLFWGRGWFRAIALANLMNASS